MKGLMEMTWNEILLIVWVSIFSIGYFTKDDEKKHNVIQTKQPQPFIVEKKIGWK